MEQKLRIYISSADIPSFVKRASLHEEFTIKFETTELRKPNPNKSHPSYKLNFAELTPLVVSLVSLTTSIFSLSKVIFESLKKNKEGSIIVEINNSQIFLDSGQTREEIEKALLLPFKDSLPSSLASNAANVSAQRTQVFISYSHQDREWLIKLQKLLKPLIRNQNIILWDDTKIKPGAKWREEIQTALETTKVAVLLVSADFLNSDFIADHELPHLIKASENEELTILWVYISACLYDVTEIGNYQSAHTPLNPLDSISSAEQQKVLTEICCEIQRTLEA